MSTEGCQSGNNNAIRLSWSNLHIVLHIYYIRKRPDKVLSLHVILQTIVFIKHSRRAEISKCYVKHTQMRIWCFHWDVGIETLYITALNNLVKTSKNL